MKPGPATSAAATSPSPASASAMAVASGRGPPNPALASLAKTIAALTARSPCARIARRLDDEAAEVEAGRQASGGGEPFEDRGHALVEGGEHVHQEAVRARLGDRRPWGGSASAPAYGRAP